MLKDGLTRSSSFVPSILINDCTGVQLVRNPAGSLCIDVIKKSKFLYTASLSKSVIEVCDVKTNNKSDKGKEFQPLCAQGKHTIHTTTTDTNTQIYLETLRLNTKLIDPKNNTNNSKNIC